MTKGIVPTEVEMRNNLAVGGAVGPGKSETGQWVGATQTLAHSSLLLCLTRGAKVSRSGRKGRGDERTSTEVFWYGGHAG